MERKYEAVVIGAGHAGCEAALACARLGCHTAMVTISFDKIAAMPCNPSIGGLGKSQIVREVDALGGEIGRAADAAAIHFRLLGASKGPAVRARRVQCDFLFYHQYMRDVLSSCCCLEMLEGEVTKILVDEMGVKGVLLADGRMLESRQVILTTGTFLRGLSHVGLEQRPCGRLGDRPAYLLSESLENVGLSLGRLKTGTPPRLAAESVDDEKLAVQESDAEWMCFSLEPRRHLLPRVRCHLTRTNNNTHEIIRDSLDKSPLFSGKIKGRGPRYCPSIEDKVVRFPQRLDHQVILEPTGIKSGVVYPNGISTSLPRDTQIEMVHSIAGLERAEIVSFGYAIEYDFVRTSQLSPTMECKRLPGLYLAGQVNGTSGYEEAAGQGILAGINAARRCRGKEQLIVSRSDAYLGVMIDDLVNHDITEPYRMFTSRSEFRLLLREDNVWTRLGSMAEKIGLVGVARAEARRSKEEEIEQARQKMRFLLGPPERDGRRFTLEALLRRPGVTAADLRQWLGASFSQEALDRLEVEVKYEGYIERQKNEVRRLRDVGDKKIPPDIEYEKIPGLSAELAGKLSQVKPADLLAASRIEGMTPAAMMVLSIWISNRHVPRGTCAKDILPDDKKTAT